MFPCHFIPSPRQVIHTTSNHFHFKMAEWFHYGEKSCFKNEYYFNFATASIAYMGNPEEFYSYQAIMDLYMDMRELASKIHLNALPSTLYLSTGEPIQPISFDLDNFNNFWQTYVDTLSFDKSVLFATIWSVNDINIPCSSTDFKLHITPMGFIAEPLPLGFGISDMLNFVDDDTQPQPAAVANILDFNQNNFDDMEVRDMLLMLDQ